MLRTFGPRLKRERVRAKMSQEKLALLADVSRNTIIRYERGEDLPTVASLLRLGNALNLNLRYLIGDHEYHFPAKYWTKAHADLITTFDHLDAAGRVAIQEMAHDLVKMQAIHKKREKA